MLENKLKEFGIVTTDVYFKDKTSFKIGGKISYFVEPLKVYDLQELIKYLYEQQIPYFILGNGTNLLASDEDFNIVVISLKKLKEITICDNQVIIEAGAGSMYAGLQLISMGYDAPLFLTMIPGTIGGAIYMNASCYGESIKDALIRVDYLDEKGELNSITNFEDFSYRFSPFMNNNGIIVKGYFKIDKNPYALEKTKKYFEYKKLSQPINALTAGSIFRNTDQYKAWYLIKELKLDQLSIGGAVVSKKHGNFLINKKQASFKDMYSLILEIQKQILLKKDINLELEIKIITPLDFFPHLKEKI